MCLFTICELCCNSNESVVKFWTKWWAGGPSLFASCSQAMGFRQVTDLSEYSVSELLDLIAKATQLVREKLSGVGSSAASVASSSEYSVVEPDSVPPVASSSSSTRNAAGLRSPYTCDFHCKFCDKHCCRAGPHKNHGCIEHRKWR